MSDTMSKTGRCMCGAVTLSAVNVPRDFGACHCTMCLRWVGGPFLGVTVQSGDLTLTGEAQIKTLQSSDWAERAWCGRCGSALWYRVTAEGPMSEQYEIPIGLFDDPKGFNMTREIFIDRKPDCIDFAGERHQLTAAETLALYAPEDPS